MLNRVQTYNEKSGFTLIELLIVIAIVGILAVIAIPYYQGYTIRARLVEVEHAISNVQSAVSSYRLDKENEWPNCPTINEVRNSLGVSLGSITRIGAISITDGVIVAIVQNVNPLVDGKSIISRPDLKQDGSFGWAWDWSPDFPVHLRHR